MFEHKAIKRLSDYFYKLDDRPEKGVYFYRINGYNEEIRKFISEYYDAARLSGVIIEGKIPNPDEKNLSYYNDVLGMDFKKDAEFIAGQLKKWIPGINETKRRTIADAMYDVINHMSFEGKTDNMLKNAYVKFMCWLYYKFKRIINNLGENNVPKILYEGNIGNYELKFITVMSKSGCDVVLLQYGGDEIYLKSDPDSELSYNLSMENLSKFPENFNIRAIREKAEEKLKEEKIYQGFPKVMNCTNAWIDGVGFDDFKKEPSKRGNDSGFFYNCYCRINGAENKLTYMSELYQFWLYMKNSGRRIVIIENEIAKPDVDEINKINRKKYVNKEQMIIDLSGNIKCPETALQKITRKAFINVISEESEKENINLNRLINNAVYLLCWFNRYKKNLFSNWKAPDISCFIYLGGCKNGSEALFMKFLSRLPVDVLILNPDLNFKCCLEDDLLYEINYNDSVKANKFPGEEADVRIGTTAYYAEKELDGIMYQDSGMYRDRQYSKAKAVTLKTTYDEIFILWDQEVKYRPDFNIIDSEVNIPVIFSKVSGIKDGDISKYWTSIKSLITDETFIIKGAPFINPEKYNPIKAFSAEFLKNGKVQKEKIKSHKSYKYYFLREEAQNYILDKLQILINRKNIKGTFENGAEYAIVSTVLNINKDILRKIQNFDFTKKNPKIIYINTTENIISLEDSILIAFLNLAGFDVIFFVPTGYRCIEKYFNNPIIEEHQIGKYVYDLQTPDLSKGFSGARHSWRDILFKR